MDQAAILGWIQLAQVLASLGIDVARGIKNAIRSIHGEAMTDTQMDLIVNEVINDATRRKLMAEADARGGAPQS